MIAAETIKKLTSIIDNNVIPPIENNSKNRGANHKQNSANNDQLEILG